MTETQAVTRKPFSPLLVALFAGVLCVGFNIPLLWFLRAPLTDPQETFLSAIDLRDMYGDPALWIIGAIFASSVFLTLFGMRRCMGEGRNQLGRLASQLGVAIPFAACVLNLFLICDEFHWPKSMYGGAAEIGIYKLPTGLTFFCFAIWVLVTRKWPDPLVLQRGLRYATNFAMLSMLISVPAHAIATSHQGWLAGISTHIALYSCAQTFLLLSLCNRYLRRYMPSATPVVGMHAAASDLAVRESALFAGAAFLLMAIAYAIYSLVFWDRFTVALLGQLGFCVVASCATARGVSGLLLRESPPFWMIGAFVLLAELVVIVAWQLILPGFI